MCGRKAPQLGNLVVLSDEVVDRDGQIRKGRASGGGPPLVTCAVSYVRVVRVAVHVFRIQMLIKGVQIAPVPVVHDLPDNAFGKLGVHGALLSSHPSLLSSRIFTQYAAAPPLRTRHNTAASRKWVWPWSRITRLAVVSTRPIDIGHRRGDATPLELSRS